jgi:hypothetical protein
VGELDELVFGLGGSRLTRFGLSLDLVLGTSEGSRAAAWAASRNHSALGAGDVALECPGWLSTPLFRFSNLARRDETGF